MAQDVIARRVCGVGAKASLSIGAQRNVLRLTECIIFQKIELFQHCCGITVQPQNRPALQTPRQL
jgi:hypothetical protein